ncbi:MAG: DUF2851 family protein [Opitutaceae bacterium]|jgi:hypothetical protein|nr:DUF2851 family protein [Opitutaceae bacterium]
MTGNADVHEPDSMVAEMPGLDGPFSFSENLLQKIWLRGDFDCASLRTADGRSLRIVHPGRWNRLAGPDFREARLLLDGQSLTGDVELHLYAADWQTHAHAHDPAYADVVLHVVLYPPAAHETFTTGAQGRRLPVLALLPWLHQDLEAYAAEEAFETLAGRPATELRAFLDVLPREALLDGIALHAEKRWRQKVRFATQRLARLGPEAACHHAALEVLGYRMNRSPMLAVAAAFPLAAWRAAPDRTAAAAWEAERERWQQRGVRPANRPRMRLEQYARWVAAAPDWPVRLREAWPRLQAASAAAASAAEQQGRGDDDWQVTAARRHAKLRPLRTELARLTGAAALGNGTRLDTFFCDAVLPLLAAQAQTQAEARAQANYPATGPAQDLWPLWRIWLPGDQPDELTACLRETGLAGGRDNPPACHGAFQGLLGWLLARSPVFRTGAK